MSDKVLLVYRGPGEIKPYLSMELLFVKDEPEEVTREQAELIMSNNPEPWMIEQGQLYHDVFEIVEEGGEE
jgi:hypothetical protein